MLCSEILLCTVGHVTLPLCFLFFLCQKGILKKTTNPSLETVPEFVQSTVERRDSSLDVKDSEVQHTFEFHITPLLSQFIIKCKNKSNSELMQSGIILKTFKMAECFPSSAILNYQ